MLVVITLTLLMKCSMCVCINNPETFSLLPSLACPGLAWFHYTTQSTKPTLENCFHEWIDHTQTWILNFVVCLSVWLSICCRWRLLLFSIIVFQSNQRPTRPDPTNRPIKYILNCAIIVDFCSIKTALSIILSYTILDVNWIKCNNNNNNNDNNWEF